MTATALHFVIEGRPRSGKNHMQPIWRGKRMILVKSDAAAEWQASAVQQLVKQRGKRPTLRGPVYVEYTAYQTADVADLDNISSALFDALAKALVIEDDKLIVRQLGMKAIDRQNPRIEVLVQTHTEAA